jgi:glucosamine--fructose-6-phosphate aminotransferase (isomerizing)
VIGSQSQASSGGGAASEAAATLMFREAAEASAVVSRQLARNAEAMAALGRRLRELKPRAVVTCARGSSDHAATFARYLIETRAGVLTSSAAPSVSSVYAAQPRLQDAVCLAISQSGKSPDLLASAQAAKDAGGFLIALVNQEDSPLARMADALVPLDAGPERSVAATKSFIATLSAVIHLIAEWTQDAELSAALGGAPGLLERAWALDWTAAVQALEPASSLYVIGRGLGLGVAQEAALKFKETCGLHAEAFSSAEVRHGPMALVEGDFPVLVLAQDDETREGLAAFTADLAARGANVWAAGLEGSQARELPALQAHPVIAPMLLIESFYRMANALSLARGLDPDRPPHLAKVTRTL